MPRRPASKSAKPASRFKHDLSAKGAQADLSKSAVKEIAASRRPRASAQSKAAASADAALPTADYRHGAKTKNLPPAGLAAQGKIEQPRKVQYAYNPHLPPVLRFDAEGASDKLPELLEAARKRALTDDEAKLLAEALRVREPWLEWAGKRELPGFAVDPVALHIHERISTQAILKVAARQGDHAPTRDMFADPEFEYREAVKFYQHDIDWANRMILGDSLQVMASLARREDLAGKVQMIYMDPPYGIKFASNFQSEIRNREVKDKESDLTREPEMVKAYRDIWTLGVHSYLTYLRDRLILARDLLADSGSIFVQISDENLHRVRAALDEVFGSNNLCSVITFTKTSSQASNLLPRVCDYLLWYCKDPERVKFRQPFRRKAFAEEGSDEYTVVQSPDGSRRTLTVDERKTPDVLVAGACALRLDNLRSQGSTKDSSGLFEFEGKKFSCGSNMHWKTTTPGLRRLAEADRLSGREVGDTLCYVRYIDDFPAFQIGNVWTDMASGDNQTLKKLYVVQTLPKVIQRCVIMTTDPGDLILDPTCGSGTTALVAEQYGRRWITIDSSRVSLAIARQRLMTARFDYFTLRALNEEDLRRNPRGTWLKDPLGNIQGPATLDCKTVPHITLKSIAQNTALDAIFAKHQPALDDKLAVLNKALKTVKTETRQRLTAKLAQKMKDGGKRAITDADRRRWQLPEKEWQEWEAPFDTDPDWPKGLQDALTVYRTAWRAKMDEVNAAIAANADNEELVDQPYPDRNIVRVAGPFTMEAVMPAELRAEEAGFDGAPEELETFDGGAESVNAEAFLDRMLRLLKQDGVQFPSNKVMRFGRLDAMHGEFLHAEGEWMNGDKKEQRVAVSVGPEYGPVTAYQVENAIRAAHRRGVDDLVFAGFSFDGAAQAVIQDDANPDVRCHLAHIRPDVNMGGLLKDTPNSQLFTVFGLPRIALEKEKDGMFTVTMEGVDIYNPVDNVIIPTRADKVAAWFLDSDYDGRTFCITQAFFPDKSSWDKLAKALEGHVDGSRFAALSGTTSLPFPAGEHKRIAVKVIDPRGNEVMRVARLDGKY